MPKAPTSPWLLAAEKTKDFLVREDKPVWLPFPGPQTQAYASLADELFFGGAAGGGKTDMLMGLAFTSHRRSIIYRREAKQFAAIVDRSRSILAATEWKFNANEHCWRSP